MPCKKHDWLFVKHTSRATERSKEASELAKKYRKESDEQENRPWWQFYKSKNNSAMAAHMATTFALMLREDGKKYICATCDLTKEVF